MENLNVVELRQDELQEVEGGQKGRPQGNGYTGPGAFDQQDVIDAWNCFWAGYNS
ncbi:hypothetical protein [Marinoscillum furvescens]|uniref:Uncharacterized protein n=1 Tax=Marinoscillum furvescens DSM 4134 TaxID=1122208 RepID=A0A3D9KX60_MARFU|nr:hypothetical protein [Marinoscillum furvescens]RED92072.1 hypothetical protein C7460_13341 [Marinoscillum furvescens DSM 4134]